MGVGVFCRQPTGRCGHVCGCADATAGQGTAAARRTSANNKLSDLTFTFYNELKNAEIAVSDERLDAGVSPQKSYSYLLQAGSFKYVKDAENLRVQLLLLNLDAAIEAVTLGSGEVWQRVLVGPFSDMSKVAAARTKLAQNRIDSLLLKREI